MDSERRRTSWAQGYFIVVVWMWLVCSVMLLHPSHSTALCQHWYSVSGSGPSSPPALAYKNRSHQQGERESERVCVLFLMSLFWVTREGLSQLLSIDWLESIDQAVSPANWERKRKQVTTVSKKKKIKIEGEMGQRRKEKEEKSNTKSKGE